MTLKRLCLAAVFVALSALAAHADPVTLTGGTVTVESLCNDPEGVVSLSGPGFSVQGNSAGTGCVSGGRNLFSFNHSMSPATHLVYQGQSYTYFAGFVSFDSSTLFGSVNVFADEFTRTPLFTVQFNGAGHRADILRPSGRHVLVFVVTTPTPEPSAVILLATGATLVAGAARRRRKSA